MADNDDNLLGGEYELTEMISAGNTTQVWEARKGSQTFAIKKLLESKLADAEAIATLKHEAGVGQKLQHPHIVRVFDFQLKRKKHGFIVMERVNGHALKSLLRNRRKYAEMTDGMVVSTMGAVADAVHYMHTQGMLHRDIKPDNILTAKGGDTKLIDFSLAAKPDSSVSIMLSKKSNRKIVGTRTYIAPEMVRREGVKEAADIYSFGITMYEMVTGRPPFMGSDPNALLLKHVKDKADEPSGHNPNLSEEADEFILRLIAKTPDKRPKSMDEVSRELKKLNWWRQPPGEYYAGLRAKAEEEAMFEGEGQLDSRADADRKPGQEKKKRPEAITAKRPAKPEPKPEPAKPEPPPQPAAQRPPQPPPPQQPPPGYPPMPGQGGMPPGYPMMPPGQMPPGYPMPQGMPGGYPPPPQGYPMAPGQMPPGYPQPGYPQAGPPGGMPPMPGQPPQPGAPPAAPPQPAAPQPAAPPASGSPAPQPAAPKPTAPSPLPVDDKDDDDIPLMTELPDVM